MQQFEIALKNEKIKLYNRLSWIIICINILVFFYLSLFPSEKNIASGSIATLILLSCCFLLKFYLYKTKTKWQIGADAFFFLLMIGWISTRQYWFSIIPAVFYILSGITVRKFIAIFSEEKITYPSFPLKTIYWNELTNAILKDGLLTINFKNDKFIQQFVDETKTVVNEQEFNDFCNQQLNK